MAKKASVTVEVGGEVGDFKMEMDAAAASYKEFENILKRGKATFEATRTPAERYEMEVAKLNQELREGAISQDTFNRAVGQAKGRLNSAATATSALAKAGTIASGVLGAFGVSFSVSAVVGGIQNAIAAAEEAALVQRKLEAVIKATGAAAGFSAEELLKVSTNLQALTGVNDEAITSGQAVLATFRNIKGDVFKEATRSALDMSAVLGTDLQSSILQIGKALNDPILGLTALRRAGVSFTDQQKEQIRTLQESGDMLGAQRIILDELAQEFGGAAERMRSPLQGFKNDLGDLSEEVGKLFTQTEAGKSFWDMMAKGTRGFAEDIKIAREGGLSVSGILTDLFKVGAGVDFDYGGAAAAGKLFEDPNRAILNPPPEAGRGVDSAVESEEELEEVSKRAADAQKNLADMMERVRTEADRLGMTESQKKLEDLAEAGAKGPMLEEAQRLLNQADAAKAAEEAAKKAAREQERLNDMLDKASKEGATAGMGEVDKRLFDLKEAGASDEQIGQARQGLEAAEAAKQAAKEQERLRREQEKMAADAQKMAESLRNPAEKYNAEVADANAKLNEGLIDAVTHQRALAKAAEDYQKAMQKSAGATGAMEKGSKEAFGFIEEARRKAAAQVPLPLGPNVNLPMPPGETVGPGGPTAAAPGGLGGGPQRQLPGMPAPIEAVPPLAPGGLGGAQPSLKELMERGAQAAAPPTVPQHDAPAPGGLGGGPQRVLPGLPDLSKPPEVVASLPPIQIPDSKVDPVGFAEGMAERARRAVEEAQARGPKPGPSTMPLPELDKSLDPVVFADRAAERARRQVEKAMANLPKPGAMQPAMPAPIEVAQPGGLGGAQPTLEELLERGRNMPKPDVVMGKGVGVEVKDTPGMRQVEETTRRSMGKEEDAKEIVKNTAKANEELAGVNRRLEKLVNKNTNQPAATLNV